MKLWAGICALVIAVCLIFAVTRKTENTPDPSQSQKEDPHKATSSLAPVFRGSSQNPTPAKLPEKLFIEAEKTHESQSQLINKLNHPNTEPTHDVQLLKQVFMHYRTVFKKNPIGVHQEMMKELTGSNPQGIVYVPKNHPAFANGQLHDRWGTPFYFHQISEDIMEVRSAGPDKRHWNSDDIVTR